MNIEYWYLAEPGARPEPHKLARHLWGDSDYDSDGNCDINVNWTELTLTRRPGYEERVDIDPVALNPLVLEIRSTSAGLARLAAEYLASRSGGTLSEIVPIDVNV